MRACMASHSCGDWILWANSLVASWGLQTQHKSKGWNNNDITKSRCPVWSDKKGLWTVAISLGFLIGSFQTTTVKSNNVLSPLQIIVELVTERIDAAPVGFPIQWVGCSVWNVQQSQNRSGGWEMVHCTTLEVHTGVTLETERFKRQLSREAAIHRIEIVKEWFV